MQSYVKGLEPGLGLWWIGHVQGRFCYSCLRTNLARLAGGFATADSEIS